MAENEENIEELIPFKNFLDKTDLPTMLEYKKILDNQIPERKRKEREKEFESLSEKDKLKYRIQETEAAGDLLENIKLKDRLHDEFGEGSG